MNLFPFDPRILILCSGIPFGICCVFKEYQKVKLKTDKKCFFFFVMAVLFFEVVIIWGIVLLCSDFSKQVMNVANYMSFSWALSCFSFSGYIFSDNALNGDVSSVDKFKGKVAIGIGIYLMVGSIFL